MFKHSENLGVHPTPILYQGGECELACVYNIKINQVGLQTLHGTETHQTFVWS